jgi:hypothetical protein
MMNENVKYHPYHETIVETYKDDVLEYIPGHKPTYGRDAYTMKNPIWRVRIDGEEVLLMLCEPDNQICKLCPESYSILLDYEKRIDKKLSWCIGQNGYASNSNIKHTLHQVITECYGNGKGTGNVSVDHINRDRLDNRKTNLRVVGQEEQISNSSGVIAGTKRKRNSCAKQLPDGITQDMLKKYVVYLSEVYDKTTGKTREFFRVENHPNASKDYASSKSEKVSIIDKLKEANKIADDLDHGIVPEVKEKKFPAGMYLTKDNQHLKFDKRIGSKKYNAVKKLPSDYNLDEEIQIMIDRVKTKYPNDKVF